MKKHLTDATTILIQHITRERLQALGSKSETYDEIITRLIDAWVNKK